MTTKFVNSLQPVVRQTLCNQVKNLILQKLKCGELKPSDKLPPGEELAHALGVSEGTVRRALEELVADGILTRRQGAGTFVHSYKEAGYWNRFQNFQRSDGRLFVYESTTVDSRHVQASEETARALGIEPGRELVRTVRHMFDAETRELIGADRLFLHPDYFPQDADARLLDGPRPGESLYQFYEREFSLTIIEASNVLTAIMGDSELEASIPCPGLDGKVLFQIERVARTYGRTPVEHRIEITDASRTRICFD